MMFGVNLPTLVVGIVTFTFLVGVTLSMVKAKKTSGCGSCSGCPSARLCRGSKEVK